MEHKPSPPDLFLDNGVRCTLKKVMYCNTLSVITFFFLLFANYVNIITERICVKRSESEETIAMSREPSIIHNPSTSEPEAVTVFSFSFSFSGKVEHCCFM